MNRKSMTLAAVMFTGFLGAAPLDLSSYVTSGRKDTIKNTGLIVTNVDMVGLSAAITGYVGTVAGASGVTSVNGQTGTVTITASGLGAITNEVDTLATVAGRGGFAGTETIGPYRVNSQRVGDLAGNGASGAGWMAIGPYSGASSSGTNWSAYGRYSGMYSSGNDWVAFGWRAGENCVFSNSAAIGIAAGNGARGTGRLYIDVYTNFPNYSANKATNDMIFGDNGQLNLGRTGALTNALPNQLRGRWQGNGSEFTDMTVSQIAGAYPASNPSNFVTAAQVSAADIRTPLVNVTTGATSTVTVTTAKRVYYVESSAQTTVTNDISALALNCTSNAEWEVWYNATSTNALAPLWDSRMQFQGGAPDMTVTGVYKFALSSPCGTVIQARQTWPSKYTFTQATFGTTLNNPTVQNISAYVPIMATTATTNYFQINTSVEGRYVMLRLRMYMGTAGDFGAKGSFEFTSKCGDFFFAPTFSTGHTVSGRVFTTGAETVNLVMDYEASTFTKGAVAYVRIARDSASALTSAIVAYKPETRLLNENEVIYYNAGGRDFR